jgi:hypothetical protein
MTVNSVPNTSECNDTIKSFVKMMSMQMSKHIAYQYTALHVLLNTEYWCQAREEDYDGMAASILFELVKYGLMDMDVSNVSPVEVQLLKLD